MCDTSVNIYMENWFLGKNLVGKCQSHLSLFHVPSIRSTLNLGRPLYRFPSIVISATTSGLCRIKILPVVGHVHGLRETLATANVALTLMNAHMPI